MASANIFRIEVEALDAGQGYLLRGSMVIDGNNMRINEHHDTENEVRARLGTGWDAWASQVDSE